MADPRFQMNSDRQWLDRRAASDDGTASAGRAEGGPGPGGSSVPPQAIAGSVTHSRSVAAPHEQLPRAAS